MVTQSFTDFVQANEATPQNGMSDRELQRLIALARIGGPEGDAAIRILETIPGGLQALSRQALPNISQQIQRRIEEPLPREYETGAGVAETPTGFIPREAEMLEQLSPGSGVLGAAGELVADPGKAIVAAPLMFLGTDEYDAALAQEHERIRQQEGDETNPFGRFLRNIEASMMAQDAPGVSESFPQWQTPVGWTVGGLEALQATGELGIPVLGAPKQIAKAATVPARAAVRGGVKAAEVTAKEVSQEILKGVSKAQDLGVQIPGTARFVGGPLTPGDDPWIYSAVSGGANKARNAKRAVDETHKVAEANPEIVSSKVAEKAHIEKGAPDPGRGIAYDDELVRPLGAKALSKKDDPRGVAYDIETIDPSEFLDQAIERSKVLGERVDQSLLNRHQAAINTRTIDLDLVRDRGNKLLQNLGWGKGKGLTRVAKNATDRKIAIMLHKVLHGELPDSELIREFGEGYKEVIEYARGIRDSETTLRLNFDPEAATVQEYFYRGWKLGKDVQVDSQGRIVQGTSANIPRVDATFTEMTDLGFEPMFLNPFDQANFRAKMGMKYRTQMQFVKALKQSGDEIIRPWDAGEGSIPQGWRIPKIGAAFEGVPVTASNKATGEPSIMYVRRWIVQNRVANTLENIYGTTPKLPTVTALGKDIDLEKWTTRAFFIPKKAKLTLSFFQDVDFLNRFNIGSFSKLVDNLKRGELNPKEYKSIVVGFPKAATEMLQGRLPIPSVKLPIVKKTILFGKAKRQSLKEDLLDTTPIIEGREGFHLRAIMLEGLNLRDRTVIPTNLDEIVRDIAEETGAMGKIKGLGRKIDEFEKAFRSGLFDGTYPAMIKNDIKLNSGPIMAKDYSHLTDRQLAAQVAKAMNIKYSTIPESMSLIQERHLRYALTRFFFSLGESEGLLRQATDTLPLVGKQQKYWRTHWIATYIYLISLGSAIHYLATGKALPKERFSPISKDSWGPLPFGYNTEFAAPDLPGLGGRDTTARLDIVGQMDTVFRILDPGTFVTNRQSVPGRALMNQQQGVNFFNEPIDDVGPGGITSRSAQLISDLFVPIGAGKPLRSAGKQTIPGFENIVPEEPTGLSPKGELIESLGINVRARVRTELIEQKALAQFGISTKDDRFDSYHRHLIMQDPNLKRVLEEEDADAAGRNKYAAFRVFKSDLRYEKIEKTNARLRSFIKDLNKYSEREKSTYGLTQSLLSDISDYGTEEWIRIDQHKKDFGFDTYLGEEPTNDFDRTLEEWYALYDDPKNRKTDKSIDWEKLDIAQERFISVLSPDIANRLQMWNRRNDVPGVRRIRELLFTQRVRGADLYPAIKRILLEETIPYLKSISRNVANE